MANDDRELDIILREALNEEEAPSLILQASLMSKIRAYDKQEQFPWWWILAIAGAMQTITLFIAGSQLLHNEVIIHLMIPMSLSFILCGFVLSVFEQKRRTREGY
jgi:hypothetical protein